ncbi:MAG: hypothetical protein JWN62_3452 [Acidimicrobiales bacterium]|nr:hypothetical protein [Acidimicrobiales bacterium]
MTGAWNDDLWPGGEPFTDFGQFGVDALHLRVFDQTEWWVDRLGRPHRLDEMTDGSRRNVIVFLTTSSTGSTQRARFAKRLPRSATPC